MKRSQMILLFVVTLVVWLGIDSRHAVDHAVSLLIVIAISPLQVVAAQTPASRDRLTFEVASI